MTEEKKEEQETFTKDFSLEFQRKILRLLIGNPNFLLSAKDVLRYEYFSTDIMQWCFKKIVEYHEKYQKVITETVFANLITEFAKTSTESDILTYVKEINLIFQLQIQEEEYIIQKVEEWIKRNLFARYCKTSVFFFNKGDVDRSFEEMTKGLQKIQQISFNPPQRSIFFQETTERIFKRNTQIETGDNKFSTGMLELDTLTNGGLGRGELGVVVGGSGSGKSICLTHIGGHNIKWAKKVLHFQLEGTPRQCEDRYEAKLLDHEYKKVVRNDVPQDKYKIYNYFDSNSLVIRFLCEHYDYSVLEIEKEITELKAMNFVPDLIIIDYADLLKPRTKSLAENGYLAQMEVFGDLKTLAMRYNCVIWTASQVTRAPKGTLPEKDTTFLWTRHNLADCFDKVRKCDLLITLNLTDEEQKARRMRIYVDKYRDDERGQIFNINTNYANMQFYVPNNTSWERYNRTA